MLKPRNFSHPPSAICPFPISPPLIPPSRNPPFCLLGQFDYLNIKNSSAFRNYDRTTGIRQEYDRMTGRQDDRQRILDEYMINSGFWPRVRACALRAPVFLSSLPPQTGRCAPPPCTSQARRFAAFHSTPKIYKIYPTWAAHVKGFFHSTGSHADCRGYEI